MTIPSAGPGWVALENADKSSAAIMSADERGFPDWVYRYALRRRWPNPHPQSGIDYSGTPAECNLLWLMLNPSTADHERDDNTIRRVMSFSKKFGADSCTVVNLFALRTTDPRYLRTHADPVGPLNDTMLMEMARASGRVVCAYGALGKLNGRDKKVLGMLREAGAGTFALHINGDGSPKHPLYIPDSAELVDFSG